MKVDLLTSSLNAFVWNSAGSVIRILAQLVVQVLLARILGPEVFGQYVTVLIIVGVGWLFSDAGFGASLIQKKEITNNDISYALGWILLVSLTVGLLTSSLAPWIASFMGDSHLKYQIMACGPIIILQAISNLSASLIKRNLNMKRLQIINVSAYMFGFGFVALLLAYQGFGVWSLIIGFFTQTIITLIFGYLSVKHTLKPSLNGDILLRNYGFSILMTNLVNWGIDNVDKFIISKQWGGSSLGAYAAAFNLSRAPASIVVSTIQSVAFSSSSKLQEDLNKVKSGYYAMLSLSSLITFPLFTILSLNSPFIVNTIYGDQWAESVSLFTALCITTPLYVLLSITGPILWGLNLVKKEFQIQLFILTIMIVGLILLAGYPLSVAVWYIPFLYLARFILIYTVLANHINISHFVAIKSIIGGTSLVGVVYFVHTMFIQLNVDYGFSQLWANIIIILSEILISYLVLYVSSGIMVGHHLTRLLVNQSKKSKSIKYICLLMAIC